MICAHPDSSRTIKVFFAVLCLTPVLSASRTHTDCGDEDAAQVHEDAAQVHEDAAAGVVLHADTAQDATAVVFHEDAAQVHDGQPREVEEANVPKINILTDELNKTNTSAGISLVEESQNGDVRSQASLDYAAFYSVEIPVEEAIAIGIFLVAMCTLFYCCCEARLRKPRRKIARNVHKYKGRVVYEWDQTASAVSIYIQPPSGMKKTDLEVIIRPNDVKVGRIGKAPFLKELFYAQIVEQESSWTFVGCELAITFKKKEEAEWPYVLKHKKASEESGSQGGTASSGSSS